MLPLIRNLGLASGNTGIIENPYIRYNENDKIIKVVIKNNQYNGVEVEGYDRENYKKYFYKEGTGKNSPNYGPSIKFTDSVSKVEKFVPGRFIKWFENYNKEMFNSLTTHTSEIIEKFSKIRGENKDRYLVTITIDGNYPKDVIGLPEYIKKGHIDKITEVSTDNGVCSLCGHKGTVYGDASPFAVYTLDKKCYRTGSYDKGNGFLNFPICYDCVLNLRHGEEVINGLFAFNLNGVKVYMFPYYLKNNIDNLKEYINACRTEEQKDIFDIPSLDCNETDGLRFNMMMYKDVNARKLIYRYITDINRSFVERINNTIEKVDEKEYYKKTLKDKDLEFKFDFLRELLKNKWINSPQWKEYVNVIVKIITEEKYDKGMFFSVLMEALRQKLDDKKADKYIPILKAIMCVEFLTDLNVILNEEGEAMGNIYATKYENYFNLNYKMWRSNMAKASFLLGVLTKKLLNVQYSKLNNTPFEKCFKGFRMSGKDIKALYAKVCNKFMEYDYYRNCVMELKDVAGLYFSNSKNNLPKDEINFFFVMGLSIGNKLDIFADIFNKQSEEEDLLELEVAA